MKKVIAIEPDRSSFSLKMWSFLFLLLASASLRAQELQTVQVKTFDQRLKPIGNIEVSINGGDFILIGRNGMALAELSASDLPLRTVKIKDDELEAASWIYSKGVVEITVRKKSYQMSTVQVRTPDQRPVPGVKLVFKGKNVFSGVTDAKGQVRIPLALDETMSERLFSIPEYHIKDFTSLDNIKILLVEKIPAVAADAQQPLAQNKTKSSFGNFNLSMLDSIQSLTVFYAVFKNYEIGDLDPQTRKRVDAKFHQLVQQMEDSVKLRSGSLIGRISDSTFVENDIRSLIDQVRNESQALTDHRAEFDEKIKMINSKLESGVSNFDDKTRSQLLSDLVLLEQLLIENESRFFKNQNDYRQIINNMREKYFDIEDLENRLSASEMQRLEEQRVFRLRLIAALVVVAVFGALVVLLIYVSNALRKQKAELATANGEINRINENLESLVAQRTQMLAEAHKELDTFLYRASHDMRSPVCSIIGLCNIARHLSEGEPKELIDRVVSTTIGMDNLLKKLSAISEINQPTNFSSVKLVDILQDVRENFSAVIPAHKIDFKIDCSEDLELHSYPYLVYTVVFNLIENSIYYSSIEDRQNPLVRVDAKTVGDSVVISVYDNGVGVDPSINDRVFDMFFKGTEKSKGHGLGLYIVSKAVDALDGKIEVESELGSYSRFIVTLPLHADIEVENKMLDAETVIV